MQEISHLSNRMQRRVTQMREQDKLLKSMKDRAADAADDVSVENFIAGLSPAGEGERRQQRREYVREIQQQELYANTPKHAPTRQQRRAKGKVWRNSPARISERLDRLGG